MEMTDEGIALIKTFEGFRARAYRDPVGVWTIGYGHTSMAGAPRVVDGMQVTEVEATEILLKDVGKFAHGVRTALTRPINDRQFSALVSFAYNVGLGALGKSSVLRAVNAGDFEAVPRRLGLWVKAGGRTLPGLVKRRAAEAALFVSDNGVAEGRIPDPPRAKPVSTSKTIWAAAAALVLAVLQVAAKGVALTAILAIAIAIIALAAFIIRERFLKLKEEAL